MEMPVFDPQGIDYGAGVGDPLGDPFEGLYEEVARTNDPLAEYDLDERMYGSRWGRMNMRNMQMIANAGRTAGSIANNFYNLVQGINTEPINLTNAAYLGRLIKNGGAILSTGLTTYGVLRSAYNYLTLNEEDEINKNIYEDFTENIIKAGLTAPGDIQNYGNQLKAAGILLSQDKNNINAQNLFLQALKRSIYKEYNKLLRTTRQENDYSQAAMKKRVLGKFDGRREIYINRPDISDLGIVPYDAYN